MVEVDEKKAFFLYNFGHPARTCKSVFKFISNKRFFSEKKQAQIKYLA